MKYINTLKEGDTITEKYLCKFKQELKNKNGKPYYSLKLQDKTGMIEAKVWDLNKNIEDFSVYDYVQIEGNVILYQEEYQLNVQKISKASPEELDPTDYIPATSKDINILLEQLNKLISSVKNVYIRRLLESFFLNQNFIKEFKYHSAAKSVHHAYLGGLLEHTVTVAKIGESLCEHYPIANKELVIAGGLLHDIGKLYELSQFPENDYTDVGNMIGHISIGVELIHDHIKEIENFPADLEMLIKHIVLSHHGEYEFGSPKRPKTIEAMIVHSADNTDSRIKIVEEVLLADMTNNNYAGYNRILNRNIRKTMF
ncbi:MAG TPA: HD domain-containing protein [Epulopiscium sp.]|nr:HD domain-containing protein [Candidatus Epulonipiscium sp.]